MKISRNQMWGLVIAVAIEILGWLVLVLIISPNKQGAEEESRFKIDAYEWVALGVALTTGILAWVQLLVVVNYVPPIAGGGPNRPP